MSIKGPGIFLAQFAGDNEPFNTLESISKWASSLGYKAVQIPTWDSRLFDLKKASSSKDYCDEILGTLKKYNLELADLSTHLQGQLVAVNPAYDSMFDGFAAEEVRGNPKKRQEWAVNQLMMAAEASKNLGLHNHVTFSGALAWPYVYPWPQSPAGLIDNAFDELAKRWIPILNKFDECGVNVCYEIHPGEDLHDGITFEMFLENPTRLKVTLKKDQDLNSVFKVFSDLGLEISSMRNETGRLEELFLGLVESTLKDTEA